MQKKTNKQILHCNFSAYVGNEIAQLRRKKKLSGEQLGCLIGVSQQQMSRYECGTCQITTTTLCLLLQNLDISLWDFFINIGNILEREEPSLYDEFKPLFNVTSMNASWPIHTNNQMILN